MSLTPQTDLGPLDILGAPGGVSSFEGLWERSVVMEVSGASVHVASLRDLIARKRAAGRVKDQGHILELQALLKLMQDDDHSNG